MRARGLSILTLFGLLACSSHSTEETPKREVVVADAAPPSQPVQLTGPQPDEPGACETIDYEGTCSFDSVGRFGDPRPDGTIPLLVRHVADGIQRGLMSLVVYARPEDEGAISKYYAEHSPVRCTATIITPPCADRTEVVLELGPPPVGTIDPHGL